MPQFGRRWLTADIAWLGNSLALFAAAEALIAGVAMPINGGMLIWHPAFQLVGSQ
jgi:hypothetical protein